MRKMYGSNLDRNIIVAIEASHGFPQYVFENIDRVFRLGQYEFLPISFHSIIHQ